MLGMRWFFYHVLGHWLHAQQIHLKKKHYAKHVENKQNIQVKILDIIGEIVFDHQLINFDGNYTYQFDLSRYPKSIYLLEISTNKGVINKKLILQ